MLCSPARKSAMHTRRLGKNAAEITARNRTLHTRLDIFLLSLESRDLDSPQNVNDYRKRKLPAFDAHCCLIGTSFTLHIYFFSTVYRPLQTTLLNVSGKVNMCTRTHTGTCVHSTHTGTCVHSTHTGTYVHSTHTGTCVHSTHTGTCVRAPVKSRSCL